MANNAVKARRDEESNLEMMEQTENDRPVSDATRKAI